MSNGRTNFNGGASKTTNRYESLHNFLQKKEDNS